MRTYSFIGSDKNAGKTTAFNFVYTILMRRSVPNSTVCVTAIGINGENADAYDGQQKPFIKLFSNSLFVTSSDHLSVHTGRYEILHTLDAGEKRYILGRSILDFPVVLEGPNNRNALLNLKAVLKGHCPESTLLIDGSIDRQFLAHPQISDAFYFVLLLSGREQQQHKAMQLMRPLFFPEYNAPRMRDMASHITDSTKSLLFDGVGNLLYHGTSIPACDPDLAAACRRCRERASVLYLNGALSHSMYDMLSSFTELNIVLDNFTLFINTHFPTETGAAFRPKLYLRYPVHVKKIFVKQEMPDTERNSFRFITFPLTVAMHNIYRDNYHEIGI